MTDKGRELVGKDSTIKDIIDHFGADEILDEISDEDILSRIDSSILSQVDDDALIDAIYDRGRLLKSITIEKIKEYLTDMGYAVLDDSQEKNEILRRIKNICRELWPKGYIGKEEAKKLICDYLDFWMDRSF